MASAAPICDIDFYADETLSNPTSAYAEMHELGSVVWLAKNNLHAIVGFKELTDALRDHQTFSSAEGVSLNEDVNLFLKGSTLNSDPPNHDASRAITFSPLTPKALKSVSDRIKQEAENIAQIVADKKEFDAACELAPYLPLTIVRDLVGLGPHGSENMLDWGGATFELMGDAKDRKQTALAKLGALRDFLNDDALLSNLSPDGWAEQATQRGIEQGFSYDKSIALMRDYIAPSLDTTISAISYGIMLFAQNPGQWDKIRQDKSLIKNAIEEIVRLNAPIRAFSRFVTKDVDVGGIKLEKGGRVLMIFGAANRDPSRFPEPDRFDIERNMRGHVGFGHGVHACLGMHLARLEMTHLFEALADRVKRFEIIGDILTGQNSTIYALRSLPVRVIR